MSLIVLVLKAELGCCTVGVGDKSCGLGDANNRFGLEDGNEMFGLGDKNCGC